MEPLVVTVVLRYLSETVPAVKAPASLQPYEPRVKPFKRPCESVPYSSNQGPLLREAV